MPNPIIQSIVSNHFDISEKSLEIFCRESDKKNPIINDFLQEKTKLEYILQPDDRENIDLGWRMFLSFYKPFCINKNITYSNFLNNKDNDNVKLSKSMYRFYREDEKKDPFRKNLEIIQTKKLPNSETLKIVFSTDFTDFFLCSTGESWSSCLDMESNLPDCFWYSLPGYIVDKNRMMVYLTDGTQKEYCGLLADRKITRSWILLDQFNVFNLIKFYPLPLLKTQTLNSFIPGIKNIQSDFFSKEPFEPLVNTKMDTLYPSIDEGDIHLKSGLFNITWSNKTNASYYNKFLNRFEGTPIKYGNGLKKLIESNKSLKDFYNEKDYCECCGLCIKKVSARFSCSGEVLCQECFSSKHD